jgi:aminopeptidase N
LANLNSIYSLQILADVLDAEKNPLAIAPIASVCNIIDEQLRNVLLRLLKRENLPYRAHANALLSLGSQRNEEDLQYLLEVAQDDSKIGQHGIVRGGALKALGLHRSEEGFKYLISRIGYNKEPIRARPDAIQGLAYSAPWQTDRLKNEAIETLCKFSPFFFSENWDNLLTFFFFFFFFFLATAKLARDPNYTVRVESVESLLELKVKSSAGSIETTRSMYSKDDQSWLNRKLRQFGEIGSENNDQNNNKELVEKLENRVKNLEERLAVQELK